MSLGRDELLRRVVRSLNGSIKVLSDLSRDPPIVEIANLERKGAFETNGLRSLGREVLAVASRMNEYRRRYWKMELLIKQAFMDMMRKRGFLPGTSREIESLKNALPGSLIKGDDRIWVYSFDHYLPDIAQGVGRPVTEAPSGKEVWDELEGRFLSRIENLIEMANSIMPDAYFLKNRIRAMIGKPNVGMDDINMKRPKIERITRPVRKVIVIKRPIPLPKKVRRPRKRVLKRLDHEVVGPPS
ncbi:hypothetical protein B6U90_02585 [Thermoplasmatales archaeon ex4484_6]|nr:MAG: hypothetical protein B6U90_02585 [Thermoplasmatales archaeon ex4484_6]RLF68187.1 MAG: hypothetical protein DRN57_04690 [Thermoplasmata archaeon]